MRRLLLAVAAVGAAGGCKQIFGLEQPAIAIDAPRGDGVPGGDAMSDASSDATDAPPGVGELMLAQTTLTTVDINLTAEGTVDWVHWGYGGATGFDRKVGGSAISGLVTQPAVAFVGSPVTASWSDGTPNASMAMTSTGVAQRAPNALQFTVAAGTTPRVLELYMGVQIASARLDLSLSDASAANIMTSLADPVGTGNVRFTVTYKAASDNQTLNVTWTDTMDYGQSSSFAALTSATLH